MIMKKTRKDGGENLRCRAAGSILLGACFGIALIMVFFGFAAAANLPTKDRRFAMGRNTRKPGSGQNRSGYALTVFDVTDPKSIKVAKTFDLENFPDNAAVDGSNVLVGHSRGVTLFDFADPSAPKKICAFKGSHTYTGGRLRSRKIMLSSWWPTTTSAYST